MFECGVTTPLVLVPMAIGSPLEDLMKPFPHVLTPWQLVRARLLEPLQTVAICGCTSCSLICWRTAAIIFTQHGSAEAASYFV